MTHIAILPFLAAFFPQDRPGPWDGDLVLLESADGIEFSRVRTLITGGGVPSLIRDRKGRLIATYQWFPKRPHESFDRIAVSFSEDDGKTWTEPRAIKIEGYPEDLIRPCDPTLVELENGRFRLYMTGDRKPRGRRRRPEPGIYSAVSTDAVTFRFEPGVRFRVEGEIVIDCAAVRLGGTWHLYAPRPHNRGVGFHAESKDGLTFERKEDVSVETEGSWLGCAVAFEGGVRFYGTGGWSATSKDGASWRLDRGGRGERGVDPGAARTADGRWLMLSTAMNPHRGKRRSGGRGPGLPASIVALGDYLYLYRDGTLLKIDPRSMKVVGEMPIGAGPRDKRDEERGSREAYFRHLRNYDPSRAPRHEVKVFEKPRTVELGRTVSVGGGGFPRVAKLGANFYVFLARGPAYYAKVYDADWKRTGRTKRLTPRGVREVDQDIKVAGEFFYHYAMLPGGAGQVRKYDKDLKIVAQTRVFRAGPTDMILDQNIAVFGGKVYAAGEYREGGPWHSVGAGMQNIPPDAKQARGVHLRIFDLDLKPIGERDLTAEIPTAAVRNQFWGLGTSQVQVGKHHGLVVHASIGNVRKFDRGESIGARQIYLLLYDEQFRFVGAKGPLSDTDRDNFWCTGSVYEDGRLYVIYTSLADGYVPGPGEDANRAGRSHVRLGIFDKDFAEIETVDLTRLGEGGMWAGLFKDGNRLYASYSLGARGYVRELILK